MGENHRLIAVEIVYQSVIRRQIQQRDAQNIVVADTAHHKIAFRNDGAHHADIPSGKVIPGIRHFRKNYFVQRLKCDLILPGSKPNRNFPPQIQKTLLKRFIVEEPPAIHILLERIK